MVPVIWAKPALDDLESIHNYIAEDSPRYARLTIERIRHTGQLLSRFPEMGQQIPELPGARYRQHVIGNYRLIYRVASGPSKVIVVALIHASRDLARAFADRDPDDG